MGFRQQYKKQKEDLLKRHNESVADKGGGQFGSIIEKTKIPQSVGFWKCTEGGHVIDFIPFRAGPDMPKLFEGDPKRAFQEGAYSWVVDLWIHRNIGVLDHPYVCPTRTNGLPCPICEHLQQNKDTYSEDEYNAIKPKRRTIYLVWCRDNSDEEGKGIQLWDVAHWFMEDKLKVIAERSKGGGSVPYIDPDIGKSVAFTRRGAGIGNTNFLGHRFEDREEPIPDKILDQSFPLDSLIKYASYEEIYEAFYGSAQDGGEVGETGVGPEPPAATEAPFVEEPVAAEIAEDECPVGGAFGVDHNQLEACEEGDGCVNWDNCYAANQELKAPPEPEPEPEPEPAPAPARRGLRSQPQEKAAPVRRPVRRKK